MLSNILLSVVIPHVMASTFIICRSREFFLWLALQKLEINLFNRLLRNLGVVYFLHLSGNHVCWNVYIISNLNKWQLKLMKQMFALWCNFFEVYSDIYLYIIKSEIKKILQASLSL